MSKLPKSQIFVTYRRGVNRTVPGMELPAREGALLAARKTYGPWRGLWAIPSGYVEPHESVVETIERELVEETGIRGRAESLVAVRHMVGPGGKDNFLVLPMGDVAGEPP